MSNAYTVFINANGPLTMTREELDRLGQGSPLEDVIRVNALNAAKRKDDGWGQELEELNRRFPMPTVEEAQAKVSGLKSAVAATVKEYQDKIAECRAALKTEYLSHLERTHVSQKIEVLTGELNDFQQGAVMRLRFAEGQLASCREFDHLRPRWLELKARAAAIAKALKV
jgi:hypothetical protein